MKAQLLAILLLSAVATASSAQTFNKERETPAPSVKLKVPLVNHSHLNEGEFVKNLRASKAAQAKVGRDTVTRLSK